MSAEVRTVQEVVPAADLGITLMYEHERWMKRDLLYTLAFRVRGRWLTYEIEFTLD